MPPFCWRWKVSNLSKGVKTAQSQNCHLQKWLDICLKKVANNTLWGFSTTNCNIPGGDWNLGVYIQDIYPPKKTNMTKENPPFKDVFLIEKMGMFQPSHVSELRGVPHQLDQGGWTLLCELLGQDNNLAEALTSRTRKTPVSRLFFFGASRTEQKQRHFGGQKPQGVLNMNIWKHSAVLKNLGMSFFWCLYSYRYIFVGMGIHKKLRGGEVWRWLKSCTTWDSWKPQK